MKQIKLKTRAYPRGEVMQKALVEILTQLPDSDWPERQHGQQRPYRHIMLGRMTSPTQTCFKVISLSRIIGPALVLRDPCDHAVPVSAGIARYYVSDYHTLGSRYHGGPSDLKYLNYIGVHRA